MLETEQPLPELVVKLHVKSADMAGRLTFEGGHLCKSKIQSM